MSRYRTDPEFRDKVKAAAARRHERLKDDPEYKAYHSKVARRHHLANRYGITPEEYDRLFEAQGGLCAICGGRDEDQRLSVDHCHKTKTIRGLLCGKCNYGIGMFDDSVDRMMAAVAYLGADKDTGSSYLSGV